MINTTYFNDVKIVVCFIVVLFGMGSWIAINGIWVELPILVDQLPERWNLPSYMSVVIQIANIGPIVYTICNLCFPKKCGEKPVVVVLVLVGATASLLLAFLWWKTSVIGGVSHSTWLLALMFFLSLVDCTSSVVFLPFMNTFKPHYITPYYIGEGFSGLVPSLVSLGQGVGQVECVNTSFMNLTANVTSYSVQGIYLPPNFDIKYFFLFIFAMMVVCGLAFISLNYLPYCKTEHAKKMMTYDDDLHVDDKTVHSTQRFLKPTDILNSDNDVNPPEGQMATGRSIYYLLLIAWVNILTNGVIPAVQSYSCLPYGSQPFHLSVTLSNIANPLACCIAIFLPVRSCSILGAVTIVGSAVSAYILAIAVYSPEPPLMNTVIGSALVVSAYVIVYLLLSFTKVSVGALFRQEGRKALLWCGAVTQLGSAVGAAVMFVIINVYNIFIQKYPCT